MCAISEKTLARASTVSIADARKRVVDMMEERGLLDKVEPNPAYGAAW